MFYYSPLSLFPHICSWEYIAVFMKSTFLLQRNDIAMAITKYDQFDFLIDIVPRDELKPPKSREESSRTGVPADQVKALLVSCWEFCLFALIHVYFIKLFRYILVYLFLEIILSCLFVDVYFNLILFIIIFELFNFIFVQNCVNRMWENDIGTDAMLLFSSCLKNIQWIQFAEESKFHSLNSHFKTKQFWCCLSWRKLPLPFSSHTPVLRIQSQLT